MKLLSMKIELLAWIWGPQGRSKRVIGALFLGRNSFFQLKKCQKLWSHCSALLVRECNQGPHFSPKNRKMPKTLIFEVWRDFWFKSFFIGPEILYSLWKYMISRHCSSFSRHFFLSHPNEEFARTDHYFVKNTFLKMPPDLLHKATRAPIWICSPSYTHILAAPLSDNFPRHFSTRNQSIQKTDQVPRVTQK